MFMQDKKIHVKLVSLSFKRGSGVGVVEYTVRLEKAIIKYDKDIKLSTRELIHRKLYDFANIIYKNYKKPDVDSPTKRIPGKPQIIHYMDLNVIPFDLSLMASKGVKLVCTIHDLDSRRRIFRSSKLSEHKNNVLKNISNLFLDKMIRSSYKYGVKFAIKKADHIIVVSEKTKEEVMKYTNIGKDKLSVVYPIIGDNFKKIKVAKNKNKIVVGHISSYLYKKNAEALVSAFKRTKNPNLELRLYGGKLPFKINDDSRIHYFGHVKDKDLPRVLNSFDVFVFPSKWEGFGMPIMEAKRCRVPVITYKKGALPKIVKAHTLQFKDEKDLTSILEEKRWEKVDTNSAYKDTKKTEPKYVAKQIDEIYHKVLER